MADPSASKRIKGRLLIIDDEEAMGKILVKSLALDGVEAKAFTQPAEGLAAIAREQPDVILTDIRMPGLDGHEILKRVKAEYPEIPVLIMTAFGTIEDAVSMLQSGAFNYITKPFQHTNLVHQIERALEHRRLVQENTRLSDQGIPNFEARSIIGSSAGLERVREMIRRAAQADSPVLITGQSGVGKELVAREIHRQSPRRSKRFVAVNCPTIPPTLIESELFGYERGAFTGADRSKMGLIELSGGGTLFLDEIGEIPSELQVKLLRVIQEREIQRVGGLKQIQVDLRVIAATNRDLEREIQENRFRPDLFYRLNVIPIHVPPLAERPNDIAELAEHFLARIARRANRPGLSLSAGAVARLKAYPWPGNIRELENTLERMTVMSAGGELTEADLPPGLAAAAADANVPLRAGSPDETSPDMARPWPPSYKDAREGFERAYLTQLLRSCDGNVGLAAEISGVSKRSLYEKIEKLGLKKESRE